jgi:hypothetical protein
MSTLSKTFVLRNDTNAHSLWDLLKANWRSMAASGKPLAVTVSEYKAKRTTAQNARYFALLQAISEQVKPDDKSFDTEIWHEAFKEQFAPREEGPNGRLIPMSTARMSVEEFNKYMTEVEVHAITELRIEFA